MGKPSRNCLVSVCVPTYNGSKYLQECLDSILAQTFSDFELLIVDDCSSDETVEIARGYAGRDPRVRVVENERNLGLVRNWNRCVQLACGEWIKFVFQDDFIENECLAVMLSAARPEDKFVSCRRDIVADNCDDATMLTFKRLRRNTSIYDMLLKQDTIDPRQFCDAVISCQCRNFVGEPTAVMLHSSVFVEAGLFDEDLIQLCDFEFWTRVGIRWGIVYVPETLATFRVHPGGATHQNECSKQFRKNVLDRLILLHKFAYHDWFRPLRVAARRRTPRVSFAMELAKASASARDLAHRLAEQGDGQALSDWLSVSARYRRMRWSWRLLALDMKRQMKRQWGRYVAWRWAGH